MRTGKDQFPVSLFRLSNAMLNFNRSIKCVLRSINKISIDLSYPAQMFRRSALLSIPVAVGVFSCRTIAFNSEQWPFDTKGMPTKIAPSIGNIPKTGHLALAGVGMRRKNLYITEVDVYLIGINLSEKSLKRAKEWSSTKKTECTLVDYLFPVPGKKQASDVVGSATLRFCRQITKDQFLTAFDEAFKGCSPEAIADFRAVMGKVIAAGMVTKSDELVLYWLDNGEIAFALNGVFGDRLTSFELNKRLLEVYIDPTRTVSKELYTCLESNINNVSV